jgi:hypothetical protein
MEGLHGFEVLTCNTLPSLVGTGGEQFRAILFMCWSPPIQISAVYCTSSSHSHHTVHFLTNLILAPRPCMQLDQRFPVVIHSTLLAAQANCCPYADSLLLPTDLHHLLAARIVT